MNGTLGTGRLAKRHLLTMKEVDLLTGIGKLSDYHMRFMLFGDWIKEKMPITRDMTTKTLRGQRDLLGHVIS